MLKKTSLTILSAGTLLALAAPAMAAPPYWAPANGYRAKETVVVHREVRPFVNQRVVVDHYPPVVRRTVVHRYYPAPVARTVIVERPAPVFVAAPAPVYAAPVPVYAAPAPVYAGPNVLGTIGGAIVGAVIGNQIGHGNGNTAATAIGAVVGGTIGAGL